MAVEAGLTEDLAYMFAFIGCIFGAVVVILSIAFVILMKYNAYGYGIKRFIDEKGNKQWQFWLITFAQIVHMFILVVFSLLSNVLFGIAFRIILELLKYKGV